LDFKVCDVGEGVNLERYAARILRHALVFESLARV
jgi:hypothetical protein